MKVFGVDPGSRQLGYSCVEKQGREIRVLDQGCLKLESMGGKSTVPVTDRLAKIFTELNLLLEAYKPNILVLEKVFFAKNPVSALKLGQVRGVVIVVASLRNIPVVEYSATEVKKALTGFGRAEKDQVAKMLDLFVGKEIYETPDASDATALAVCHAQLLGASKGVKWLSEASSLAPSSAKGRGGSLRDLGEHWLTERAKNLKSIKK
jgi:crossover junction endodeoxyribonuclease RuvC